MSHCPGTLHLTIVRLIRGWSARYGSAPAPHAFWSAPASTTFSAVIVPALAVAGRVSVADSGMWHKEAHGSYTLSCLLQPGLSQARSWYFYLQLPYSLALSFIWFRTQVGENRGILHGTPATVFHMQRLLKYSPTPRKCTEQWGVDGHRSCDTKVVNECNWRWGTG